MILPFSTQLNGRPTFFVEKIHKAFRLKELNMKAAIDPQIHYTPDYNFFLKNKCHHKIHTIREDKKDRWKPGILIDFFINCRQKNMFRFAPRIPVVSVQKFQIIQINSSVTAEVFINNICLTSSEVQELALNDGFDTVEAFFEYFNEDYVGKIIHWTNFKY